MEFPTDLWAAFSNNPTPGSLRQRGPGAAMGLTPAAGEASIKRTWTPESRADRHFLTPQFPPAAQWTGGFGAGLFPLHSPLLGESWLVSFPPLSDMLKFSG